MEPHQVPSISQGGSWLLGAAGCQADQCPQLLGDAGCLQKTLAQPTLRLLPCQGSTIMPPGSRLAKYPGRPGFTSCSCQLELGKCLRFTASVSSSAEWDNVVGAVSERWSED